jgi:hypothetical protein
MIPLSIATLDAEWRIFIAMMSVVILSVVTLSVEAPKTHGQAYYACKMIYKIGL